MNRMLEDDIDKLIAEMQSKPYDSSRYQQEPDELPQSQLTQFSKPEPQSSNFGQSKNQPTLQFANTQPHRIF